MDLSNNSGSQQSDQIMNALNAILHVQEAMVPAIEHTLQRFLSVHGTPRQQQTLHKQQPFTYETYTYYLTNRLVPLLEERARLEAPVLLELRYLLNVVSTHIVNIKLKYPLDLCVRRLKTMMGLLTSSISVS